uniref:Lysine ketoglutarate reductase trans-splicing protein n=1 Tax=Vitis vinifera TaxID=29760 RepID=F6HK26_VITVI
MKTLSCISLPSDPKSRSYLCSLFIGACLFCGVYFIASEFTVKDYKDRSSRWQISVFQNAHSNSIQNTQSSKCKNQCRPSGSEALPEGIVVKTSNLEVQPLWGATLNGEKSSPSKSLLAMAVGIKQKEIVNQIVEKFILSNFVVMLFHYDGVVDEWREFAWSDHAIHVTVVNQTKWWFAKRFLHPDIVAEYNYIFLWDEDLGVENFHPGRYVSIVEDEGLEISQPALDPKKSRVHHQITARVRNSRVHRRTYKHRGSGRCDDQSTAPPCVGWVEMMAPVFSKAAWRCVWHMIQNELIHAWGVDMQLGYCAQGDRTKNVGVVDSEYVVHLALPTLGVLDENEAQSEFHKVDNRSAVRRQSFIEMQIFRSRWANAVKEDKCWIDPYAQPAEDIKQ